MEENPSRAVEGGVAISLKGLHKSFGKIAAVDGVDLDILNGEFFSMLGPSGSGKTTVLRLIAGFERPTTGRIWIEGADITERAPFERDVSTVFQDYALFGHMNVRENVAYGLRIRKVKRTQRREMAEQALETVRLSGFGDRKPSQLSGGQRQRVALARALVIQPKVLLLDEPLGALDRQLRQEMQLELAELQRQVAITFIFVTHDQEEALTMSDRIAVFNDGRVQQVGSAAEIYERPMTEFVAGFVGTSNLLQGETAEQLFGATGTYAVRPEKIRISMDLTDPAPQGMESVTGKIAEVVYLGAATRFVVDLDTGGQLVALQQNLQRSSMDVLGYRGAQVRLSWSKEHRFEVDNAS
jgi:putative spermidine/putrescine transport system ATP-binding protein